MRTFCCLLAHHAKKKGQETGGGGREEDFPTTFHLPFVKNTGRKTSRLCRLDIQPADRWGLRFGSARALIAWGINHTETLDT